MAFGTNVYKEIVHRNIDRKREEEQKQRSETVSPEAIKKARDMLKSNRVNISDFNDLEGYGDAEIARDTAQVKRIEQQIVNQASSRSKENTDLAVVLEAMFYEHSEQSYWLGENASTVLTSRFDDLINGIDTVVEFKEQEDEKKSNPSSHLGLAVDATFGRQSIQKKLLRIKQEISNGIMPEVKYFQSEDSDFKGKLKDIPRVVIGAEADTIKELAELWCPNEEAKEKESPESRRDALKKHQIQFQILEEILIQLDAFAKYAKREKQNEIAEVYESAYAQIKAIFTAKHESADLEDQDKRDIIFGKIQEGLSVFQ